jgi:hypothetical protein
LRLGLAWASALRLPGQVGRVVFEQKFRTLCCVARQQSVVCLSSVFRRSSRSLMLRRGDDDFSAQEIAPALIDRFHKTLFSLEDRPGCTGSVDRKTPCRPVAPIGDFSQGAAQSSHQGQSRGYITTACGIGLGTLRRLGFEGLRKVCAFAMGQFLIRDPCRPCISPTALCPLWICIALLLPADWR